MYETFVFNFYDSLIRGICWNLPKTFDDSGKTGRKSKTLIAYTFYRPQVWNLAQNKLYFMTCLLYQVLM